jgi:cysteine sulfinate desulfinase/cysteine desulfurase-like protein
LPSSEHEDGKADHDSSATSPSSTSSSATVSISHVLKAMKVPIEYAQGTLRFSVGKMTSDEEIDEASVLIAQAVVSEWNQMGKL